MISKERLPILYFLLGFTLFMFTRSSAIFPTIQFTIVLAPVFILRFIRSQPARRGVLYTLLGFLLSMNIALWVLFDIKDASTGLIFDVLRSSTLGILYFIPYMIDRFLYPKFKERGILSTLIFPVSVTAILFLSSLEGPFDGEVGKSIYYYGNLAFKQLASLFGLWAFVFMYSWLASTLNYLWESNFKWDKIKNVLILFISVVLCIFIYGTIRLTPGNAESDTVRVAAIVLLPENSESIPMDRIFTEKQISPLQETLTRIEEKTKEASIHNAQIVSFQEFSIIINEEDQDIVQQRCSEIASKYEIYLNLTFAYFAKEGKGKNKQFLFDDQGTKRIEYDKRFLMGIGPYGETGVFEKGNELIQVTDTPYGRIGISTCRDMAFPSYIRQAGKQEVDIMLGPSYDWPESKSPSYQMRSVENGFSFVRASYNGYTYTEDFLGRILDKMPFHDTRNGILYSELPTKGRSTLYSKTGDVFAWICLAAMLTFIAIPFKKRIGEPSH